MAATKGTEYASEQVVLAVTIMAAALLCAGCTQDEVPLPTTLSDLFAAAEGGDANAQYRLGDLYSVGISVPRDNTEAVQWYHAAAKQGHADAQYEIGQSSGSDFWNLENSDEREAFRERWYRHAAEQGHAEAQYELGHDAWSRFVGGRNEVGADDWAEALRWYHRAAEQGHTEAQYELGEAYMYADRFAEALRYELGDAYPDGNLQAEAFRWYRRAAEQGHAEAQYRLAFLYRQGDGVPRDASEARSLYYSLSEPHNLSDDALFQMGLLQYRGEHNVSRYLRGAAEDFRSAAEKGHAEAAYYLGLMLYNGEVQIINRTGDEFIISGEGPENKVEARLWFRRAASDDGYFSNTGYNFRISRGNVLDPRTELSQDEIDSVAFDQRYPGLFPRGGSRMSIEAQYRLGLMIYRGEGGYQSHTLAARWYCAAARNGHSDAQASLGALYSSGLGVPEDLARAYYWISISGVEDSQDAMESLARRMTHQQLAQAQEHMDDLALRLMFLEGPLRDRVRPWSSLADCAVDGLMYR